MIARLADLREFEELRQHFFDMREEEVKRLARKTFANPDEHDRSEWVALKARWAGIEEALDLPIKKRKELNERS